MFTNFDAEISSHYIYDLCLRKLRSEERFRTCYGYRVYCIFSPRTFVVKVTNVLKIWSTSVSCYVTILAIHISCVPHGGGGWTTKFLRYQNDMSQLAHIQEPFNWQSEREEEIENASNGFFAGIEYTVYRLWQARQWLKIPTKSSMKECDWVHWAICGKLDRVDIVCNNVVFFFLCFRSKICATQFILIWKGSPIYQRLDVPKCRVDKKIQNKFKNENELKFRSKRSLFSGNFLAPSNDCTLCGSFIWPTSVCQSSFEYIDHVLDITNSNVTHLTLIAARQ